MLPSGSDAHSVRPELPQGHVGEAGYDSPVETGRLEDDLIRKGQLAHPLAVRQVGRLESLDAGDVEGRRDLETPVTGVLLVEALGRLVSLLGFFPDADIPVTGGVRGEYLVNQPVFAADESHLELGVSRDDAPRQRVVKPSDVEAEAKLLHTRVAHPNVLEVYGFVVPFLRLGGGSEDRLRKSRPIVQPGTQDMATDRLIHPVLLPARSGQVAPTDTLHRDNVQVADDQGRLLQSGVVLQRLRQVLIDTCAEGHHVVVALPAQDLIEPEDGQGGQHCSLVRDGSPQDKVVDAQPVGRPLQEQVRVARQAKGVAHFPP